MTLHFGDQSLCANKNGKDSLIAWLAGTNNMLPQSTYYPNVFKKVKKVVFSRNKNLFLYNNTLFCSDGF